MLANGAADRRHDVRDQREMEHLFDRDAAAATTRTRRPHHERGHSDAPTAVALTSGRRHL
jgi:hypothetical protein